MIAKCLKEEQVPGVDERLVRVVHIIVEQYDGDVRAFVESIRRRVKISGEAVERSSQPMGTGRRGRYLKH
jgi:hypothetical protein